MSDRPALSTAQALGLMLLAAFLWGLSFPIIKAMAGAFPPITLAALRGAVSASTLLLWFALMRQDLLPRSTREAFDWLILGALNGWIANLLVAYAVQTLPAGKAAMIQACGPLITALIASRLFADERITPRRLFGILVGLGGVGLLIGPRLFGEAATPLAAAAMVGVAVSYAIGNIYVRLLPVAEPKRLALGQQVMSGLFASALALATLGPASFSALQTQYHLVLIMGVVSTAAPMVLYMIAIRAVGPTRASMTGYLVPAWAVVLSALLLGEAIAPREVIAGLIILAGVYLVTAAKKPA
ncbi:MAG: DMT family transporter [Beijerinckiaceae bacterium]|nr:DMT family transporter [Beijerinckiaceae bacterium]